MDPHSGSRPLIQVFTYKPVMCIACIHTRIYTYIHTPIHTYIYIHIYIHTYIHAYIHTYMHTYCEQHEVLLMTPRCLKRLNGVRRAGFP